MRPLNFTVRPQINVALAITACVLLCLLGYLLFLGEWRVALAFAIAPIAAPLIGTLETRDPVTFLFASAFAYPLSLLMGIPAYLLFRRLGWLQIWSVLFASAFLGGTVAILLFGVHGGIVALKRSLLFCAYGAATGLLFWVIAFAGLRSNNRWRGP